MNFIKNRKEDVIFIAVLLVLIVIFVGFKIVKGKKVEAPVVEDTVVISTPVEKTQPKKIKVIKEEKPVATVWPELSYSDEFNKYRNGRLVQFNPDCQVFPTSLAIANGSSIMLDNRSNVQQVITLGDNKYTLAPFDFEIMTLTAPQIPTTYLLDCNERQNVTTLILE